MFKLLYVKLTDHPQLGNVQLQFVEDEELSNAARPYTTVIIGPNGTGKSFIMRTIADIFRQFKEHQVSEKMGFKLPFSFHIRYKLGLDIFEIIGRRRIGLERVIRKKDYFYCRNRPVGLHEEPTTLEPLSPFLIPIGELRFPQNVIVSSILLNDRFTFADSKRDDFYQYVGVRRTRSSTSTSSIPQKTVKYLFDSLESSEFCLALEKTLHEVGFEKHFTVHYWKRYKKIFFSGDLTPGRFEEFFTEWWKVTRRKKDRPPYSAPGYKKMKSQRPEAIKLIIDYLNGISTDAVLKSKIKPDASKFITVDLFSGEMNRTQRQIIEDLVRLDILSLAGISVKKREYGSSVEFSIDQTSSGEAHLIISLIGLFSKMKQDNLVFIDEPELSLHPNWQMKYIELLKQVFQKYSGSHFVLASHSHFIISDLEGESSSIIALNRDHDTGGINAQLMEGTDTFGWSAEEVLYKVFGVRSTRNSFLEFDLTKLVTLINRNSTDFAEIRRILDKIRTLHLSGNDPLVILLEKAQAYLESQGA